MTNLAFTPSSFLGASLRTSASSALSTPRCSMGDSIAPQINIKDTKSKQTSSVTITEAPVSVSLGQANGVLSNIALAVTLKAPASPNTAMAASSSTPDNASPVDYYFPSDTRNQAPFITITEHSVAVDYALVNPSVAGVASKPKKPFWRDMTTYKYADAAADVVGTTVENEVLSTKKYEKYFPTNIRNLAPLIKITKETWNNPATVSVSSEYVGFNPELSRLLKVVDAPDDQMSPNAAGTVSKNYPADVINKAPVISISNDSVSCSYDLIEEDLEAAGGVFNMLKML